MAGILEREAGKDDMFSLLIGGRNMVCTSDEPRSDGGGLAHGENLSIRKRHSHMSANNPVELASLKYGGAG